MKGADNMDDQNIQSCEFMYVHEDIVKKVQKSMPDEDEL